MKKILLPFFAGLLLLFLVGCGNNNTQDTTNNATENTEEVTDDTSKDSGDDGDDSNDDNAEDTESQKDDPSDADDMSDNDETDDEDYVDPNARDAKVGEEMTLGHHIVTITDVSYTDERKEGLDSADKVMIVTYTKGFKSDEPTDIDFVTGQDIHLEVDGEWMEEYGDEDTNTRLKSGETKEGLIKTFVVVGDGKPRLTFSPMDARVTNYYNVSFE